MEHQIGLPHNHSTADASLQSFTALVITAIKEVEGLQNMEGRFEQRTEDGELDLC